jgi:hypothetical protein
MLIGSTSISQCLRVPRTVLQYACLCMPLSCHIQTTIRNTANGATCQDYAVSDYIYSLIHAPSHFLFPTYSRMCSTYASPFPPTITSLHYTTVFIFTQFSEPSYTVHQCSQAIIWTLNVFRHSNTLWEYIYSLHYHIHIRDLNLGHTTTHHAIKQCRTHYFTYSSET